MKIYYFKRVSKQASGRPNWKCLKTFIRKWKSREILKIESNDRPTKQFVWVSESERKTLTNLELVFDSFHSHWNKKSHLQCSNIVTSYNKPILSKIEMNQTACLFTVDIKLLFWCWFHSSYEIYFCFVLFYFLLNVPQL